MKTKRNLNILIALTGALMVSVLPTGRADDKTKTQDNKVQLMFVQTADDLKADGTTLRLVNVGQQTLYFSDRPARVAGHLTMPAYMDEWKTQEGPDNFSSDPPNATLSVYESGNHENTLAVVKISHPVIDGKDLVYSYKLIERYQCRKPVGQRRCSSIGSVPGVGSGSVSTAQVPGRAGSACGGKWPSSIPPIMLCG